MDRQDGTTRVGHSCFIYSDNHSFHTRVQIQILLHLLILSLPGPSPPPPQSPELSSVKRRKRPRKKTTSIPTPEDRLEAFMDKLSMWQLMGGLDTDEVVMKNKDELDWIQSFCQNVVEPLLVFSCVSRKLY